MAPIILIMKPEVRIIAWDDCAFSFRQKSVRVVGAIFRGGSFLDGLLSTRVDKDGNDATEKIVNAILNTRHYDQLSYIMLDGITLAGFNVVDIRSLSKRTKLPVIAIQRKKPNMKEFLEALKKIADHKKKMEGVKAAGKFFRFGLGEKNILYQRAGISNSECADLLKITCVRSNIPEPLRVAHLIASGLSGESRGGA